MNILLLYKQVQLRQKQMYQNTDKKEGKNGKWDS